MGAVFYLIAQPWFVSGKLRLEDRLKTVMRYQQSVKYKHDYEVMCDFVISTLPINDSVTFCYLKGMTVL